MTPEQEKVEREAFASHMGIPDDWAVYPSQKELDCWRAWLARAAQPVTVSREVCEWTQSDDPDFCWWDTACGEAWTFIESGPKENGMKFCPYCGKELCVMPSGLPDDVRNDEP